MKKLWHVAWHEYRRHVFNRRFVLVSLLSVPLVILVIFGLIFLIISLDTNTTPLGYVDFSGLLAESGVSSCSRTTRQARPDPSIFN